MNQNNSNQIPQTQGNNMSEQVCYIQEKCDCVKGIPNAMSNPTIKEPRPVYVCPKDYKKAVRLGMVIPL